MTLDEAIEILQLDKKIEYEGPRKDLEDALQLGSEALKGIKKVRKTLRPYVEALLPGETED